jgi:hypothetical protein
VPDAEILMRLALDEASAAADRGDPGFGAVVARAGQTVASTEVTHRNPLAHDGLAVLGEACRRLGKIPALRQFESWADTVEVPWARAVAARCRTMLIAAGDPSRGYTSGLALHEDGNRPDERARTELVYARHCAGPVCGRRHGSISARHWRVSSSLLPRRGPSVPVPSFAQPVRQRSHAGSGGTGSPYKNFRSLNSPPVEPPTRRRPSNFSSVGARSSTTYTQGVHQTRPGVPGGVSKHQNLA